MPLFENGRRFGIYEYVGVNIYLKRKELNATGDFKCSICANISKLSFFSVISKQRSKCRYCTSINLKKGQYFNGLTFSDQDGVYKRSDKLWFVCTCGNLKSIKLSSVVRGKTRSCGECNVITLKKGDMYGSFTYDGEDLSIHPKSHQKATFICKCGKVKILTFKDASKHKNCSKCDIVFLNHGHKFGNLSYNGPSRYVHQYSSVIVDLICGCGNACKKQLQYLFSSKVTRCGHCFEKVKSWFDDNIKSIKSVSHPSLLPGGGPIYISGFINSFSPFEAKCAACGEIYKPRLRDIKTGRSITCGCSNNKISSLNVNMKNFLISLGKSVLCEYQIGKYKFDLCVDNLLIEINGLKWHSYFQSKQKDINKYKTAISHNYDYVMIYEDELLRKEELFGNLLANRLNLLPFERLRPNKCQIKSVNSNEINAFYDKFHYIGSCNARVHYGVFYQNQVIAAISFSKPTRQTSKHEWELLRMASNNQYKVCGIWSKLMKQFIGDHKPKSIVSFSDNRLFSGEVYGKIGFVNDGQVPPDYYWVKGRNRFHKSGLRKTEQEKATGFTEAELREAQGFKKIWDLGKTRWVYSQICPKYV